MQEEELVTIRTLEDYRALLAEVIRKYRGRVVDSPGDNVLAEFASVVDAVESAVEIQKDLEAKNAELPENRRMEFRIGINLRDVVEEGERIYGDGVNITARVEGLAEGGGSCISGPCLIWIRPISKEDSGVWQTMSMRSFSPIRVPSLPSTEWEG